MPMHKASDAVRGAENNSADHSGDDAAFSKDIAALAYFLWMDRGCPDGSPDQDWFRAEELATTSVRPQSF